MIPTANQLFKYADRYYNKNNEYPTFRQAAQRFKCRQEDIESVCSDQCDLGYLGAIVAYTTYSGVYHIDRIGDYLVEAY